MGYLVNLICSALLVLLGVYLYRKKTREKRMNAYFCNAVRVYALTDEEDVRVAILTAAKAAAKKQRESMVKYLQKMALKQYTDPEILERTDKIGFGTPGDEWMCSEPWQNLTDESYNALSETFQDVFKKNGLALKTA